MYPSRLQETCLAVDAVSLFLQLPALVDVNTQQGTNVLTQLLVSCVQCSTAACLCLAGLGKKLTQLPAPEEEGEGCGFVGVVHVMMSSHITTVS